MKNHIAFFLTIGMLLSSSMNSVVMASETVEESAVSDVAIVTEDEFQNFEEIVEDESKMVESEITDGNSVCSNNDYDQDEFVIDVTEIDSDNAEVALFSDTATEASETAITENDGFQAVTGAEHILYKYDAETTTLYFKLAEGATQTTMPDRNGPSGSDWLNATGDNAASVTRIVIEDGITHVGAYNFEVDGSGCFKNVRKVELASSVTSIGNHAFDYGYKSASSLLKEINLENVETIGTYAFQYTAIENVNLDKVISIGEGAFIGCSNIKTLILGAEEVKLDDSAFQNCTALESVKAKKIINAESTFSACSSLKEFSCTNLNGLPKYSFKGTTSLKSLNVKGIKEIGRQCLDDSGIEELLLDQADISISHSKALSGCTSLKMICYAGTSEQWKNALDARGASIPGGTKLHCCADEISPKKATCTETGLAELVCDACGGSYTDGTVIPALDHEVADTYTVDKAATCTESGEKSKHCTREGCEYREDIQTIPVDSENHDWTSKVTTEPTCTKEGVLTYTCSRCNTTKTEPIKATGEHSWTSEITTEPTCTKTGVLTYTCSSCKETRTEPIDATGVHQWSSWKTAKKATVFEAEQQTRTCSSCNKTETRTVGTVLKAKASVNASTVKLKVKQSTSGLKVTGLANGDSVKKWKSSNTKVFTVSGKTDGTCKLTAKKKGTAKLEITMASGLKKTVTVKVQSDTVATTKISGLTSKLTLKKGSKTTLKPVITPFTSTQKVTYSSSDKKVASVSSKGVVTAKKAGTAKITVKSGSKKVVVTVTVPKIKTTDITVVSKATVKKGKTYSLKAKVTPGNSDQAVTYTSSNKKVATVTKTGTIKGVKKGTATITVKSGSVTKKVKVTVK